MGHKAAFELDHFICAGYRFSLWQMPNERCLFQKHDASTGMLAGQRVYDQSERDFAADDFAKLKSELLPNKELVIHISEKEYTQKITQADLFL